MIIIIFCSFVNRHNSKKNCQLIFKFLELGQKIRIRLGLFQG